MRKLLVLVSIATLLVASSSVLAEGNRQPERQSQHSIHDANGDGLCDVCGQAVGSGQVNAQGQKAKKGKHFGSGDGTGNQGNGPQDGTGYGAQSGKRSGPQDGSGVGIGQQSNRGNGGQGNGRRGGRP